MRTFTQFLLISLLITSGLPVRTTAVFGQSRFSGSITGDILHAESGSDFIGILYSKGTDIYYIQVNTNGSWGPEQLLGVGSEGRIAIDLNGNPHVVYTSSGKIAYLSRNGNSWSEIQYIESNHAGACLKPDIAVSNNGFAHISYTDTKGNVGNYTDRPDIMYAENSSGTFVKSIIFNGFLDYYGGADRYAEYFDKGSFIETDQEGNYYILTHKYQYQTWMGGNDKQYSIIIQSNLGTGSTSISSSDIFSIHDLDFNGTDVFALYKQSTFKVSELTVSGAVINFSNTQNLNTSSVSSIASNDTDLAVGGNSVSNLYTLYNDLEHVYANVTVKNSVVSAVDLGSAFYVVYTDNADGMIKITEVAKPLSFTRFDVAGQKGSAIIDGQAATVKLTLAAATDLTNLVATYTTTSDVTDVSIETVPQTSGVTVNNFSSPVTYSLKDGTSTRNWVVTAKPEISKTIEASICEGENYPFGTQSPSEPGNYIETFISVSGNDSTVLLILTVNPTFNVAKTISLCENELPYTFGTQSITSAGEYEETFTSVTGCDSLVTLNLIVKPSHQTSKEEVICANELPYLFGSQSLTESGEYQETFQNIAGCDSLVTLNLVVNPTYQLTKEKEVCENALPYSFGSQQLTVSGQYQEIFQSIAGCDSLVTLNFTVKQSYSVEKDKTICSDELPYSFGSQNLIQPGTYSELFVSRHGCDSLVTLNLNVNQTYHILKEKELCSNELPYVLGSKSLTESGVYSETFNTIYGCDSTITLTLTVNPAYNLTSEKSVFLNEIPFQFGTQSISESGTYTENFQSVSGCDSTITLTLTVSDKVNVAPNAAGTPISISLDVSGNYSLTADDIFNLTKETTDSYYPYSNLTFTVTPNVFSCNDAGQKRSVKITATNPSGMSDICYTDITVYDRIPPQIVCRDIALVLDNSNHTSIDVTDILVSQSDACEVETISLSQTSFDCRDTGENQITVTAADKNGNISTCKSTVTITTLNHLPTIDAIADQFIREDSGPLRISLSGITYGTDCENQKISINASTAEQTLISGININYTDGESTATLEILVAPDESGTAEITVQVSDSKGEKSDRTFRLTVSPVNDTPTVSKVFTDITMKTTDTLKLYISPEKGVWFDDKDTDDVLQIEVKQISGATLPTWIIFRNDSLIATPQATDVGCFDVLVQASDKDGLHATNAFKICSELSVGLKETNGLVQTSVPVYPNPTSGIVYVEVPDQLSKHFVVVLSDHSGNRLVLQEFRQTKRCSVDLSNYVSGIYILQVYSDKAEFRRKILLRK